MPDFLIRDLNEDLMIRLRARAQKNGRSLQAEIKEILTRSVKLTKAESMELIRKCQEELKGRDMGTDSTILIREDRNSH